MNFIFDKINNIVGSFADIISSSDSQSSNSDFSEEKYENDDKTLYN